MRRIRHWATAVGTFHGVALGSIPQPGTQSSSDRCGAGGQFISGRHPPAVRGAYVLKRKMNLTAAWISVCFIHQ